MTHNEAVERIRNAVQGIISNKQMTDAEIVDVVRSALAMRTIPARRITIDLTEAAAAEVERLRAKTGLSTPDLFRAALSVYRDSVESPPAVDRERLGKIAMHTWINTHDEDVWAAVADAVLAEAGRTSTKPQPDAAASLCPRCEGAGTYQSLPNSYQHSCAVCNGTGKIGPDGTPPAEPTDAEVEEIRQGIEKGTWRGIVGYEDGKLLLAKLDTARREKERLSQQIALAGGFHERTQREIEIEAALEQTPVNERDPADVAIGELLALVDAGRNRVHEEIERREKAETFKTAQECEKARLAEKERCAATCDAKAEELKSVQIIWAHHLNQFAAAIRGHP